jgi:hypothetical protein
MGGSYKLKAESRKRASYWLSVVSFQFVSGQSLAVFPEDSSQRTAATDNRQPTTDN